MPVSADLFDVLERSKRMYERSGGAFDVTIAPVGRLWRRARRDRKLPDPALLAEARQLVGSDKMVLDPAARTVQLTKPGMKLDVGGIAKGYAAQAALDVLKTSGNHPGPGRRGRRHRRRRPAAGCRGLEDRHRARRARPRRSARRCLLLKNAAVSTAGDAERFVDDRRPSLFPHHQSEHRHRASKTAPA